MSWPTRLKNAFAVDLRALALMRVGIGLVVLIDLMFRLTNLRAHYTDWGVMPRELMIEWNSLLLSFHFISGRWEIQLLLLAVAAFFSIKLILGKHTQTTTIIVWALTLSLHNRNIFVLQGGDDYLRMILFWAMFIPWGKVWSIDAQANAGKPDCRHVSLGSSAYIMQIMIMYVATAFYKSAPEWNTEWTALYFALQLDQFVRPLGKYMLNFPNLLIALTLFTVWLEKIGTFFFVVPFYSK